MLYIVDVWFRVLTSLLKYFMPIECNFSFILHETISPKTYICFLVLQILYFQTVLYGKLEKYI